jgi:hypothetical protein
LTRYLLLVVLAFLTIFSFAGVAFADPIPWEPPLEGKPIQSVLIVAAEFCGLLAGTAMLCNNGQIRWQKATMTMAIALIISYAIGITIWSLGYMSGFVIHNTVNPFFNASSHPLGTVILLLPELFGTIVGTIIIRLKLGVEWKTALITMASAMIVSFLVGMAIVYIYLKTM